MTTYCHHVLSFHRCGAGVQNRQSQPLGDHHPHHAHVKRPRSTGRSADPSPHLRVSQLPRDGAWEKQRGSGGAARASSERGARPQEDQSREWVFVVGGALPDPRLRQRPVLLYHHCQTGKDLQVRYYVICFFFLRLLSLCSFSFSAYWAQG